MTADGKQSKPLSVQCVQCVWCRKLFSTGGDMSCGARVPTHLAAGPDGAWCRTADIVQMLEDV